MTECIVFEYEHQRREFSIADEIINDAESSPVVISEEDYENITTQFKVNDSKRKEKKYPFLGISNELSTDGKNKLVSTYVVGYKWLNPNRAICVKSKIDKTSEKRADITKMFSECFHNPHVAKTIDQVYHIDWDAPKIEIDKRDDELTPMIIVHFLNIIKTLSKKGLKKGYITVTENLTAKVKGKILVNQTLKYNHFKNRLDKTVCSHQIFTANCLENKILKTALAHVSRYVYQNMLGSKDIIDLLHFDQTIFESIDTQKVNNSDFRKIKHSPFYKEYKEALKLAEMIFKRIGFSLNHADRETQGITRIPPYHIDMSKLFEHYVEMKLRELGGEVNAQFYTKSQPNQRPDFLYKDDKNNLILDAKYKYWYSSDNPSSQNQTDAYTKDLRQLALYAITKEIRTEVGIDNDNQHIKKVIVYPVVEESKVLDFTSWEEYKIDGFVEMYKVGISVPTCKSESR